MKKLLSFALLLLVLFSCKTYTEEDKLNFDKEISTYLKKHKIVCKRSKTGLYYHIYNEGTGRTIQYTDNVSFSYKGKLLNGTMVDYQVKPVTFEVKDLIAGWKEIMLQLKPGAKAYLVVPPHLGYGDNDLEKIPKNSILVFEMEINKVQ